MYNVDFYCFNSHNIVVISELIVKILIDRIIISSCITPTNNFRTEPTCKQCTKTRNDCLNDVIIS